MQVDSGVDQCLLLQELGIGLPGNSKKKCTTNVIFLLGKNI